MKARIPALTVSQQKAYEAEAKRYVIAEWDKLKSIVTERIVRRSLKVACVALHNLEGYGAQRLERFVNECGKITAEIDTDPLLLEHIDQLLMDKYGMKWGERDYAETDEEFFRKKQ